MDFETPPAPGHDRPSTAGQLGGEHLGMLVAVQGVEGILVEVRHRRSSPISNDSHFVTVILDDAAKTAYRDFLYLDLLSGTPCCVETVDEFWERHEGDFRG